MIWRAAGERRGGEDDDEEDAGAAFAGASFPEAAATAAEGLIAVAYASGDSFRNSEYSFASSTTIAIGAPQLISSDKVNAMLPDVSQTCLCFPLP